MNDNPGPFVKIPSVLQGLYGDTLYKQDDDAPLLPDTAAVDVFQPLPYDLEQPLKGVKRAAIDDDISRPFQRGRYERTHPQFQMVHPTMLMPMDSDSFDSVSYLNFIINFIDLYHPSLNVFETQHSATYPGHSPRRGGILSLVNHSPPRSPMLHSQSNFRYQAYGYIPTATQPAENTASQSQTVDPAMLMCNDLDSFNYVSDLNINNNSIDSYRL